MTSPTLAQRHGTYSGYQKHLHDRTPPCEPCSTAARDYMRNYRNERVKSIAVPAVLIGAMYANAPIELQELAETILGVERLERFVIRYDAGEEINA